MFIFVSERHDFTDVNITSCMYVTGNLVNTSVWLEFTCKVAHQKSRESVHICKSYCEKMSGTFFIWTLCTVKQK